MDCAICGNPSASLRHMNPSINTHPYLCSELVSIAAEHSPSVCGNLEAISQSRLVVLTDIPLRQGTQVSINTKEHVLKGTVERCNIHEPLGCYIEVRLKPESRWSKRWFVPEHLLALGDYARARMCA
jgi:hypothetical protein